VSEGDEKREKSHCIASGKKTTETTDYLGAARGAYPIWRSGAPVLPGDSQRQEGYIAFFLRLKLLNKGADRCPLYHASIYFVWLVCQLFSVIARLTPFSGILENMEEKLKMENKS
jgi:hypothetical protein